MPSDTPVAEEDVVASIVSYLVKPEAYFINGMGSLNKENIYLFLYLYFD